MFVFKCILLQFVLPLLLSHFEPFLALNVGLSQLFLVFLIVFVLHLIPTDLVNFEIIALGPFHPIFRIL
jgi:hypothetical protein